MNDQPYVEAYAMWDDPDCFRVYPRREDAPRDDDDVSPEPLPKPMEAVLLGESVEVRLYRAAYLACSRDFTGAHARVLGFKTEAAAKRVARAVNAEIKRIAKGQPPPTTEALGLVAALAMAPRRGRR